MTDSHHPFLQSPRVVGGSFSLYSTAMHSAHSVSAVMGSSRATLTTSHTRDYFRKTSHSGRHSFRHCYPHFDCMSVVGVTGSHWCVGWSADSVRLSATLIAEFLTQLFVRHHLATRPSKLFVLLSADSGTVFVL